MSSTKPNSGVPEFLRIDNMSANEYVSTEFYFLTFEFLCQFSACQAEIRYWHNSGGYVSYYFGLFLLVKVLKSMDFVTARRRIENLLICSM